MKELLTKEKALEVAEKYAKENNLILGRYIGESFEALGSKSYCWDVDDPTVEGKFIGWPFWIAVNELGAVLVDNDPLDDLTGGDEIEDDE
jgi:hypothetical protein